MVAAEFDHLAPFPDHLITGDTGAVAQADRPARGQALVTGRRVNHEVVPLDQDVPLQGDGSLARLADVRREVGSGHRLHRALPARR